jgi:hypothetical protein
MDVIASTPSGGWHIYLRTPPGWAVPTRLGLLPGVDVKGDGGYVAAPPTHIWVDHAGGRERLPYRWAAGCPCSVPPAPPWFSQWISSAVGTGANATGGSSEPMPDLEQLAASGLPQGGRNVTLHRLACSLFRRYGATAAGLSRVREAIGPVLAATDCTGFPASEIERILRGAMAFVRGSEEREEAGWQTWQR